MFNNNIYMHAVFIGAFVNLLCHSYAHIQICLKATSEEGF